MKPQTYAATLAAILSITAAGIPLAQAHTSLPPVHKEGRVEYLSGGIGQDESSAIRQASHNWPLTLEFAVKDRKHADFTADVNVIVRGPHGKTALQTLATGPFMLARLAPGHYTVEATLAGKTQHRTVSVRKGHPAKVVFIWPAETGKNMT